MQDGLPRPTYPLHPLCLLPSIPSSRVFLFFTKGPYGRSEQLGGDAGALNVCSCSALDPALLCHSPPPTLPHTRGARSTATHCHHRHRSRRGTRAVRLAHPPLRQAHTTDIPTLTRAQTVSLGTGRHHRRRSRKPATGVRGNGAPPSTRSVWRCTRVPNPLRQTHTHGISTPEQHRPKQPPPATVEHPAATLPSRLLSKTTARCATHRILAHLLASAIAKEWACSNLTQERL